MDSRSAPSDTHALAEELQIAGFRKMSAVQRLECVCALNHALRQLALADIRRRHPEAGPREQALRLASRWIDPDLMRRAFGWDVDTEGY